MKLKFLQAGLRGVMFVLSSVLLLASSQLVAQTAKGTPGVPGKPDISAPTVLLEKAQKLEVDGMSLLTENYLFEESLFSEGSDRIMVFFSLPHGARVIIDEVNLLIDGKPVAKHAYSVSELLLLQGRAVQLIYAGRIPIGDHTIKFEPTVIQGRVKTMSPYSFTKSRKPKFFEVELSGSPVRQFEVKEW